MKAASQITKAPPVETPNTSAVTNPCQLLNHKKSNLHQPLQTVLNPLQLLQHQASRLVYQRINITLESYGDVELDDDKDLEGLIEEMEREEEIANEVNDNKQVRDAVEAYKKRHPEKYNAEDGVAKEKADRDTGGWLVAPKTSAVDKFIFLQEAVRKARTIIPTAFNRKKEDTKEDGGLLDKAYECRDNIATAYMKDLTQKGVNTQNQYIHPAALERMLLLVKETKPADKDETDMPGVCKDFASLCYGLILQNDHDQTFKPRLAFLHNHVYVEANIEDTIFAIDAWIAYENQGGVMFKSVHARKIQELHSGIKKADHQDNLRGRESQASLNEAYAKSDIAKLVWYTNEATYREIALNTWNAPIKKRATRGAM